MLIKRLTGMMLMVCLLLVSTVCLADHNDLRWGMNCEEVQKVMGEKAVISRVDILDRNDKWTCARYPKQKISKFTAEMTLYYVEGSLHSKVFHFAVNNKDRSSYQYLSKALTKKYGNASLDNSRRSDREKVKDYIVPIVQVYGKDLDSPEENENLAYRQFDSDNVTFMIWDEDDTYIILNCSQGLEKYIKVGYISKYYDLDGL